MSSSVFWIRIRMDENVGNIRDESGDVDDIKNSMKSSKGKRFEIFEFPLV